MDHEHLLLAFRLHVAELIVGADSDVHPHEVAHLKFFFPREKLVEAGFVDAQGQRTDAYADAAMAALETLPDALEVPEKVTLLEELMGAVLADGSFDRAEGTALVQAARLLELDDELIQAFLDAHIALDGVKLAELEDDDG